MLEIEFCVLKKMEPPPIEKHLPTPLSGLNSCQTSSNYNVGNKKKKTKEEVHAGKRAWKQGYRETYPLYVERLSSFRGDFYRVCIQEYSRLVLC